MIEVVRVWGGSPEALLSELNRKQFKRVIGNGMVTLPMVASVDITLAATLNYTLQQKIAELKVASPPTGALIETFYLRLTTSSFGIDLSNDALRAQLTDILASAGWSENEITEVLSLGAVIESHADRALGRDATQEDVDAVYRVIARERLQQDYQELFHTMVQPKLESGTREEVAAAMEQAAASLRV